MSTARRSPFAMRLRVIRAQHPEISQATLAGLVGVAQHTISKWERGLTEARATEIAKLCDVFAVSADYLIGRSDSPTGIDPGMWLIDLDAGDSNRPDRPSAIEVPRRHRIVDHREKERLKDSRGKK